MKLPNGKRPDIKAKLSPCVIFFIIVAAAELLTFILALLTKGSIINDLLFHDRHDTFMDYFNPLMTFKQFSLSELYEDAKVFYPPLSMVFYLMMYKLIPDGVVIEDGFAARASQITLFPFCIYLLLCTLAVVLVISEYKKGAKLEKMLFILLALLSYPMLYQLERANIIILAFIFTFLFVYLKDSNSKVLRELGLICLAIAAGIKVYPALFGLLLLIEKRWKDAIRCVIYGVAAFVLPALIFGGINPIDMILSLGNMSSGVASEGFGYKVNFANTLGYLADLLGAQLPGALVTVTTVILGALCIASVFAHRSGWKRLCLVAIFIAGIPGVSYAYVMIFMLIPIAAYLNETKEKPRCALDYIYAALLALCISPLPFSGTGYAQYGYPMTATVLTESIALIVLLIILAVDGGVTLARAICDRKNSKATAS